MKPTHLSSILLLALLAAASPAQAQDLSFKQQIEQGEYKKLGKKLEAHLELDKYDAPLRTYSELNLEYLARGAKPKIPGSEVILVRGAKNDRLYQMPNENGRKRKDDYPGLWDGVESYPSGGPRLMLPNRIRHARRSWDDRLPLIDQYFRESTTLLGGDGESLRELERIIEHHKGGGLGTSANSTASVLISASTRPLWAFGPPYYILKVAPERCIFNYKGLSGEFEVLLPFWILPHEIVARCDSREEVENHPAFKNSPYKDLEFHDTSSGSWPYTNNWELIEANIRNGRPPLPINPTGIRSVRGLVKVEGRKVSIDDGNEILKITSRSVASKLRKFEGRTVKLKGTVETGELDVEEIVSPTLRTLTAEVIVSGDDVELSTSNGDRLETSGTLVRALPAAENDLVTVEGWVFTNSYDDPEHIYITAAYAQAKDTLKLRSGAKVPKGGTVRISYVSRSGRSAIVKTDNGWGWVSMTKLTLGESTANTPGMANALSAAQ